MNNIPIVKISDYNFELPPECIAKYPAEQREESKLLVFKEKEISQNLFKNIDEYLQAGDSLVLNNTKVFQARFNFTKHTGAQIEIFCLEPIKPANYEQVFNSKNSCVWKCFIGNAKRWKEGNLKKELPGNKIIVAEKLEQLENYYHVRFTWEGNYTFTEMLADGGIIPIPPYLKRNTEEIDNSRYQTVYSKQKGSVAAPTAGLHFTDELIDRLKKKTVSFHELTLHVGAGTFKPVETENVQEHVMHNEVFTVTLEFIQSLKQSQGRIISVGTTSARTLESLYWIAHMIISGKILPSTYHEIFVEQWYAYENNCNISRLEALNILEQFMTTNNLEYLSGLTQIIIMPSYKFRMINGLITNFHLPKSTLLLLIAAFIGEDWKKAYDFALKNQFRFLSYGDSSLLLK